MKALDLANSAIVSLYQSAPQGCAGIGRQLHPLKAKDLTRTNKVKANEKNTCMVMIYQSKALDIANLTIPLLCQSAHRGCAGTGRQLHLLKANDLMMD